MPDVVKSEVVLAGPEKRHHVEAFPAAEYITRRRLSLAFGHHPMLDSNIAPRQRVGPSCDVSGSEDPGDAGLEMLVHRHALVDLEAGSFGKFGEGFDPDSNNDQVGLDRLAILEHHLGFVYRDDGLLKMEDDSFALM